MKKILSFLRSCGLFVVLLLFAVQWGYSQDAGQLIPTRQELQTLQLKANEALHALNSSISNLEESVNEKEELLRISNQEVAQLRISSTNFSQLASDYLTKLMISDNNLASMRKWVIRLGVILGVLLAIKIIVKILCRFIKPFDLWLKHTSIGKEVAYWI